MLMARGTYYISKLLKTCLLRIGYCSRPRFLVIGAQKCGTDGLYHYLSKHPKIARPIQEINYFDQDRMYNRGHHWYHSHFPPPHDLPDKCMTFDSTPEYLYYPKVAKRIYSYDSEIKLIVLLREPVSRAFSAWNMYRNICNNKRGWLRRYLLKRDPALQNSLNRMLETKPFPAFDTAVREEINGILSGNVPLEPGYVQRGLYYEQLRRYFMYFDRKQIKVIGSSRLRNETQNVLNEVTEFVGLASHDWDRNDLIPHHVGKYETQIEGKTYKLLRHFYEPYNKKLWESLGYEIDW